MDPGTRRWYWWYLKKNSMSFFHSSTSLTSLFKRTTSGRPSFSFGQTPDKDWKILLGSSFLAILLAIGVSIFVYTKVNQGEIFLVDKKEVIQPKVLNRFELERTISYFESRNEDFLSLKREALQTADPFIPDLKPKYQSPI